MEADKKFKIVMVVCLLQFCLITGYLAYRHFTAVPVTELTSQQVKSPEAVAKAIDQPISVAKEVVREINTVTRTAPAVSYQVPAANPQQAAKVVEQQIKNKTAPVELPPADKTIVTPQEQKVDVYRINLNKDHKIKVGATYLDNHAYWNVGYQQKRLEVIAHMEGAVVKGYTAMYTVSEW